jgi:hypothetical protein
MPQSFMPSYQPPTRMLWSPGQNSPPSSPTSATRTPTPDNAPSTSAAPSWRSTMARPISSSAGRMMENPKVPPSAAVAPPGDLTKTG